MLGYDRSIPILQFAQILIVIANEAKRNEAIAKSSYCDYFASFHYARNDKLYFSTFGMLPLRQD